MIKIIKIIFNYYEKIKIKKYVCKNNNIKKTHTHEKKHKQIKTTTTTTERNSLGRGNQTLGVSSCLGSWGITWEN